ncbi:hypothetical protein C5E07_02940 [Pseudoclavibacter sp. RFBJ3]|uniref:hypothetical protein n=1 Tax=unclassified Pseudoclavibacter TaxID=2615177 RepID=UPI000CE829A3|nr:MULTISPECIES: hypothetical protein [unclassified Pseudoclavibacter]PPF80874.1 hypothetical protein C5C12_16390 [Pseudoclavibacter sp. RFBJ5]PPF94383.1 hypothetical protein C5E07_02940 [Pseudoclavibacter sp. RFBJ3]PPF99490.1 hypothetical protein C5C19_04575 [Pseudoclavibacter sp. RFBH5]PPG25684.1 hypothetical protein C5E13_01640 [Pseudoclavibacter sp. RFBI4]
MDYLVHINGRDFVVGENAIEGLRSSLLGAASAGGGFVELPHPTAAGTAALVLPESAVWIEPVPGEVVADEAGFVPDIAFVDVEVPQR